MCFIGPTDTLRQRCAHDQQCVPGKFKREILSMKIDDDDLPIPICADIGNVASQRDGVRKRAALGAIRRAGRGRGEAE